jgi:urease accessory protein
MLKAAERNATSAHGEAESLLGDVHALLRQVGSPGIAADAFSSFWSADIDVPSALGRFLRDYIERLLGPCELPAIVEAFGHARRGELREMLAQDQRLAGLLLATPFCAPSLRIGRQQLARLRPLRDARLVQRYLAAVESGQAHGWHSVVYGITLAVYSLPLRQGLVFYSQETLSCLALAACRSRQFTEWEVEGILSEVLAFVPDAVEAAVRVMPSNQ